MPEALSMTAAEPDSAAPLSLEGFSEERHGELFAALCLITRNRHEAEEMSRSN